MAVTHDCDFPPSVRSLPRVTASTIPPGTPSAEIDRLVRSAGERGDGTFHVDAAALRAARPDAILGQAICRVCAVTLDQLPADLPSARTIPLEGSDLAGVLGDIRHAARELGVPERGDRVVADLEGRLARVRERVAGRPRPRVACIEWTDPIFPGGHWVPEQVVTAGGDDVLGPVGTPSVAIPWDDVLRARPDVLVVMPCGFGTRRALREAALLAARPGFADLPAARSGRVFAVDGSSYFSRPGPRVVDGVEILAALLHPDLFAAPPPERAQLVPLPAAG